MLEVFVLKINILGTEYSIEFLSVEQEKRLEESDGFTDWTSKRIVLRDSKDIYYANLENMNEYVKKVLRHEIIHAFLTESGLNECSAESEAWARNEEAVDWFAKQGLKIYKAWQEAGAV